MTYDEFKKEILQNEHSTVKNKNLPAFWSYMHARVFLLIHNYRAYYKNKTFFETNDFSYFNHLIQEEELSEEWERFLDCVLRQLYDTYIEDVQKCTC